MTEKAKELKKEYARKYRKNNLEKLKEYQREWRANNKEKVKQYNIDYWNKKGEQIDYGKS